MPVLQVELAAVDARRFDEPVARVALQRVVVGSGNHQDVGRARSQPPVKLADQRRVDPSAGEAWGNADPVQLGLFAERVEVELANDLAPALRHEKMGVGILCGRLDALS